MSEIIIPRRPRVDKGRCIEVDGAIARVPLTRGHIALIDAADVPLVDQWNWAALVVKSTVYAFRSVKAKAVLLHRVIVDAPAEMCVDHIDGNGLNNRRQNLRLCSHQENIWNHREYATSATRIPGASRVGKRFKACIYHNGKTLHLGTYDTPEEAGAAYRGAVVALRREFAPKN